MDLIREYTIPYLHPLLVHFPLVLLLLGAASAVLYLVLGRGVWRQAGLMLFALGALGAWGASETGHALRQAVEGDPIVEQIVGRHQDAADWTLWVSLAAAAAFALVSLSRIRFRRRRPVEPADEGEEELVPVPVVVSRREPLWGRLFVLLPAVAAAALVAWTAHLGGLMVWGVPR